MLAMILEQINGRNMFSIFGGVPEFTFVRDGRLRSQGAFSHPILAGSYGAALVPLSYCIWVMGNKKYAISGFVVGTIMVITSASSGPLLSFLAGILGLLMWHFRNYMRIIVWLFMGILTALHLIMNAPVWALIYRVAIVGGSTGYHRYSLIDRAIKNFGE